MNKKIIIKYIEGKATPEEKKRLLDWMNESPENSKYFAEVRDLFILSSIPQNSASGEEMKIAEAIMAAGTDQGESRRTGSAGKKHWTRVICYGAAAAVFIALCVNIALMLGRDRRGDIPRGRLLLTGIPADYLHTIYTNRGVKGEVVLPDGSVVKLNSDSRIVFPDKFSGSTREVYVSGEAYFAVVTNPDTPMIVSTNRNLMVKVCGTEFNIRSYPDECDASATLFKGRIDLLVRENGGEDKILAVLKPNESFVLEDRKPLVHVMKADTLRQGAWRYGKLVFDLTPMDEVIRELERWHGAEFIVKDTTIYDLKFSANFKQESLVQILEILKFCTDIDYRMEENTVTLFYKK